MAGWFLLRVSSGSLEFGGNGKEIDELRLFFLIKEIRFAKY